MVIGGYEPKGVVAALGNFDGVHIGHQKLFECVKDLAAEHGAPSGAVVFDPHPRRFFRPDDPPFLLSQPDDRDCFIRECGLVHVFRLGFNRELASMSPEAFVQDVLKQRLGLAGVVTGDEFRFGAGRAGDSDVLTKLCRQSGISYRAVTPITAEMVDEKIGSSGVRDALKRGDVKAACQMLARPWQVTGQVEVGQRIGRTIGFPTANIRLGDVIHPRNGVYAVRVKIDGEAQYRQGVANFGRKPTLGDHAPLLETHILDFDGDLYDRRLEIAFIDFLRDERKFDGLDSLKAQITNDRDAARQVLVKL